MFAGIFGSAISVDVGPDQGNVQLAVSCSVSESFDTASVGGLGVTIINRSTLVDLKNQELVWGEDYKRAKKHCDDIHGLSDGPNIGLGVPHLGDPPDLAQILVELLKEGPDRAQQINKAAEMVRNLSGELADALAAHAQKIR